jgi:ATP-binding protein involved in chromosome partitioning
VRTASNGTAAVTAATAGAGVAAFSAAAAAQRPARARGRTRRGGPAAAATATQRGSAAARATPPNAIAAAAGRATAGRSAHGAQGAPQRAGAHAAIGKWHGLPRHRLSLISRSPLSPPCVPAASALLPPGRTPVAMLRAAARRAASAASAASCAASPCALSAPAACARALATAAAAGAGQVPDPYRARAPLHGVTHCVAVASGKGGVGKSTVAANVAVAAAASGLRVGLLDADVYGPSLPLLMGLRPGVPPAVGRDGRMLPPTAHGVVCMSMGLLLKGTLRRAYTHRHARMHAALHALTRHACRGRCCCVARPDGDGRA